MNKEILLKHSPTAQVRLLTLEVLSDGKVHSRKDFLAHIKDAAVRFGLDGYSMGCISGGIQQAVNSKGCEKIGSATYQIAGGIDMSAYGAEASFSSGDNLNKKAAELCRDFSEKLIVLSRTVDFVSASDKEIKLLMQMRECISKVDDWTEAFDKGSVL